MSEGKIEVNLISLKRKWSVQWTIEDIFSHIHEYRFSPEFSCSGSCWFLGFHGNDGNGWVQLDVCMKHPIFPKTVNFSIHVKTASGGIESLTHELSHKFGSAENDGEDDEDADHSRVDLDRHEYYEVRKCLKLSELQQRKVELAPSGNLTVIFLLEDDSSYSSRLTQFSDDIKNLFVSKKFCDATLKVKHEEFSVHRGVLAARSPVFDAMFEADMKEKKTGVVDIPDCQPNAFRDFLTYIYCGISENLYDNVFELYRIADKYGVLDLKEDCLGYMKNNVSVNNVFDASILAIQFCEKELESIVQDFFCKNFKSIVHHDDWSSFSKENHTLVNELLSNMYQKK